MDYKVYMIASTSPIHPAINLTTLLTSSAILLLSNVAPATLASSLFLKHTSTL